MSQETAKTSPGVFVCTHLPPPVDGLAFASLKIIEAFEEAGTPLKIFAISGDNRDATFHFRRAVRTLRAGYAILFSSSAFAWVYMPANSGLGALYNIIIATCARARKKRIILHHHSFKYVDTKSRLISVLLRICGADAVQVVLCGCMREKLEKLYGRVDICFKLPSDYYAGSRAPKTDDVELLDRGSIVLGHLSNLTLEKGLDDCIALHRALIARGDAVTLVVGGPCYNAQARQVLDAALLEFSDSLTYLGPLNEAAKDEFYRRIDIFLFPTRYRNEADPIVVSDAQSYGVSTAVVARGCLPERVNEDVGILVSRDADFVTAVLNRVPNFESLINFAQSCGPAARALHLTQRSQAVAEFLKLISMINSP